MIQDKASRAVELVMRAEPHSICWDYEKKLRRVILRSISFSLKLVY